MRPLTFQPATQINSDPAEDFSSPDKTFHQFRVSKSAETRTLSCSKTSFDFDALKLSGFYYTISVRHSVTTPMLRRKRASGKWFEKCGQ